MKTPRRQTKLRPIGWRRAKPGLKVPWPALPGLRDEQTGELVEPPRVDDPAKGQP